MFVDLGDMSSPVPVAPDSGPGLVRVRFLRHLVPLLAVLLLVAGAGAGPRDRSEPVVDVSIGGNARILIDGGTLFTLSSAGHNAIAAYALDGGRRWSARVAEARAESLLQVAGGSVLVTASATDTTGIHTESFDAVTGRRMWTSHLGAAFVTPAGILVTAAPAATGSTYPSGYQLLDPMSGHAIWSIDVPDGCASKLAGGALPTRLVEVCDTDSSLRVVDLSDGRTSARQTVGLGHEAGRAVVAPEEYQTLPSVLIAGTTILVTHRDAPTATMDAYALADLQPLWGHVPVSQGEDVQQCGVTLCLTYADTGIVLDAATGAVIGPMTGANSPRRHPPSAYALVVGSSSVPVPMVDAGSDIPVAPNVAGPAWLVRAGGTPVAPLRDVAAKSCVQVGGYLACATGSGRIAVWLIRSVGI
jgi:hypothetical protein